MQCLRLDQIVHSVSCTAKHFIGSILRITARDILLLLVSKSSSTSCQCYLACCLASGIPAIHKPGMPHMPRMPRMPCTAAGSPPEYRVPPFFWRAAPTKSCFPPSAGGGGVYVVDLLLETDKPFYIPSKRWHMYHRSVFPYHCNSLLINFPIFL